MHCHTLRRAPKRAAAGAAASGALSTATWKAFHSYRGSFSATIAKWALEGSTGAARALERSAIQAGTCAQNEHFCAAQELEKKQLKALLHTTKKAG